VYRSQWQNAILTLQALARAAALVRPVPRPELASELVLVRWPVAAAQARVQVLALEAEAARCDA